MAKEKEVVYKYRISKDILVTFNGLNSGLKLLKKGDVVDFEESNPDLFQNILKGGYIEEVK
jgi:hypothetical protein